MLGRDLRPSHATCSPPGRKTLFDLSHFVPTECLHPPIPFAKGALLPPSGQPKSFVIRPSDDLAVVAELVDAQR